MDSEEIEKWDEESERAWKNDTHNVEFPDSVVALLKEILESDSLVLDAGCGIGKHIRAFQRLGYFPIGVDQSAKAVEYARELNPDVPLFNMRLQQLLTTFNRPAIFDLIHTSAVLQHSTHERKQAILKMFHYLLKPKGYLLCTECTFTPETLKLLKETNPAVEFNEEWTDGYSFSEKRWIQFMAENGFQHIKTIYPWPYYLFQKV